MRIVFFVALWLCSVGVKAQSWIQSSDKELILDNGLVHRVISFEDNKIASTELSLHGDTTNFLVDTSREFSFLLNGQAVDGQSGWELQGIEKFAMPQQGQAVAVALKSTFHEDLYLKVNYVLYPELPLIRKWVEIENLGLQDLKIDALQIEDLQTILNFECTFTLHNYARMKNIGRFVGNWDDPVCVVHDIELRKGMALGNEAIGVLKRTAYHTVGNKNDVQVGLTTEKEDFPFRKYVAPEENFVSPKTFICLYNNRADGFEVVNEEVNRFVTLHMNPRIVQLKDKPTFVYNTWYPFRTFVSDTLVQSVADAAAKCGLQELIIDDGWQVNYRGETSEKDWGGNYGDWLVDEHKFKGGLKPTFDYIKSKNMKPGLWISIASATGDAQVFQEHPEWFVVDKNGKYGNLHFVDEDGTGDFYSASFGTEWYDYIKGKIVGLVKEHGLEYAKLDLAVVTSPYINDDENSGSYAKDHELYKDHNASYYVLYERLLKLFDELHEEAPNLFIDCTFETAGKFHMMDYAIAQHAEGNWLSNFEDPQPFGALRVRQMAWWRSPAVPAASLVIGNLPMDDPNFELGLKSLIGTLPIVLGDPRLLSEDKAKQMKTWSDWMKNMQEKYDYMSFRKDLPGFYEPREGAWDGWQRINFAKQSGGLVGVFRQGALESERQVFVTDLKADQQYVVRQAPTGKKILKATGKSLMERGFRVKIDESHGGEIFEIQQL